MSTLPHPPPPPVMEAFAQDPILTGIILSGKPQRSSRTEDLYLKMLSAIVSQQLSTKAAATIFSRFQMLFPDQYPHPETLAEMPDETLRSAGLSAQKTGYIRNVASFAAEGNFTFATIAALDDEALIQHLTQIKGVGRWTAEMLLMFALERPDVLPLDDLGIQNAIKRHYNLSESGKPLRQKIAAIGEGWRPYRTIACKYLWQSLDNMP